MSPHPTKRRAPRHLRLVLPAGAAILCLGVSACSGASSADTEHVPVVAVPSAMVADLLPGNSQSSNVDAALFTPLTRVDGAGDLTYAVAESMESTDQVHWTITVRDGWTFHDGTAVTAQSFADSWNLTALGSNGLLGNAYMAIFEGYDELNPAEGQATATTLSGVEVVDDLTLEVTLAEADSLLPYELSGSVYAPVPATAADDLEAFGTHPVGNGPFEVPDGWEAGAQDVVLERYDDYAGTAAASAEVDLRIYESTESYYTDYQSGAIDVALLTGDQLAQATADVPDLVTEVDLPATVYLAFPLADERYADADLRRAVSSAIDRQGITDSLLQGQGTPATGLAPAQLAGAAEATCTYCTYDAAEAKELLAAAGGFDGTMTLYTYQDTDTEKVVQAVANGLTQTLGIATEVESVEISQLYQDIAGGAGDGPVLLYVGSVYPQIAAMARPMLLAGGALNVTGYDDAGTAAAFTRAAATADTDEATSIMAAAVATALDDVPVAPVYHPSAGLVRSDRVDGVSPEYLGGVALAGLQVG